MYSEPCASSLGMTLDDKISDGEGDRASGDVLVVEPVSAHEISEALEPARGVLPVGDGVLIAELALECGAD